MKLKMKLTAIAQATTEIDRFVGEDMPDDNQLAAAHKQAIKRTEKLQEDLQTACNELTAMTVVVDECFGDKFFSNLVTFIEDTRKNEEARTKVTDMKNLLSSRGIVTHQTNIDTDQVKTQLPIFTGSSSISIIDASDTWVNILKNSGIHRQIWGNIILGRIQDPALSSIPLSVKREAKFDEICKALKIFTGKYPTERSRRFWSGNANGFCLLPNCINLKLFDTPAHILLHCVSLTAERRRLLDFTKTLIDQNPFLENIVPLLLNNAKDEDKMQFLIDCSVLPQVIDGTQKYGDIIMNLCFKISRTWCRSLHIARSKGLGRYSSD